VAAMSPVTPQRDLSLLARPSGAFAMLAVDQREAMRNMFAEHQQGPVTDEQVTAFKLAATQILSPYASGVLVDKQFAFDQVVADKAVAPGCGLIAAADHFIPAHGEVVGEVEIDGAVVPEEVKAQGAVALKLLVIYRPDGDPGRRIRMVEEFLDRCHSAGLISLIEPVSRKPADGRAWDWDEGVIAAAKELGSLGVDLYKAEVPLRGQGDEDEIRRRCSTLTKLISSPWVVLSSGIPHDLFPKAVELACREGASGFLAGRAVWASVIGSDDIERDLREISVQRLQRLCEVVDAAVRR
jgi:sulfofructosephosphate aldolase